MEHVHLGSVQEGEGLFVACCHQDPQGAARWGHGLAVQRGLRKVSKVAFIIVMRLLFE